MPLLQKAQYDQLVAAQQATVAALRERDKAIAAFDRDPSEKHKVDLGLAQLKLEDAAQHFAAIKFVATT